MIAFIILQVRESYDSAVWFVTASFTVFMGCDANFFQVTDGERLTLTLWFSRDSSHDEDAKLISILSQQNSLHSSDNVFDMCIPLPASSNMYWFASDQSSNQELGFNICWARMLVLGYSIYFSQDMDSSSDISELMMEPLQLARGDELFYKEFTNILHALQVPLSFLTCKVYCR